MYLSGLEDGLYLQYCQRSQPALGFCHEVHHQGNRRWVYASNQMWGQQTITTAGGPVFEPQDASLPRRRCCPPYGDAHSDRTASFVSSKTVFEQRVIYKRVAVLQTRSPMSQAITLTFTANYNAQSRGPHRRASSACTIRSSVVLKQGRP